MSTLREYRSDTSLVPGINRTQSDRAAGLRPPLFVTQSEPALTHGRKPHPLLDDTNLGDPHTYAEIVLAAETLENIVAEGVHGATAGAIRRFRGFGSQSDAKCTGREMSDRVLRLVYGTMKYLPYIDTILVKTQFLVYNNQFLNHLGLVKIALYDLMRYHFDIQKFPGINYSAAFAPTATEIELERADIVKDLDDAVRRHNIKLAAAFARIRIERRATGDTIQEQMENILPEDVRAKEQFAVEMPQTVRINFLKSTKEAVAEELRDAGFRVKTVPPSLAQLQHREDNNIKVDFIEVDENFWDFLVIPAELFSDIKQSPAVTEGRLIFQDRASAFSIKHLESIIGPDDYVIDARVGCGVTCCSLAALMRNRGRIFAFENRPSRLESLKLRLAHQNVQNVRIIEAEFLSGDPDDELFSDVSTIIVEPPNSAGAIVDKLGYLLQEEGSHHLKHHLNGSPNEIAEFPTDQYSGKDIAVLKRTQLNMIKHAMSFKSVNTVIYITRASKFEENEQVVEEILAATTGEWKLSCVLPDVVNERRHNWEIEECLKIHPSEAGNGVFISSFMRIPPLPEPQEIEEEDMHHLTSMASEIEISASTETLGRGRKGKKGHRASSAALGSAGKLRTKGSTSSQSLPRLTKSLSESVNRLSVPKRRNTPDGQRRKSKLGSNPKLSRHDSKAETSGDAEGERVEDEEDEGRHTKGTRKSQSLQIDITVFGVCLQSFYAPQEIALQQIGSSATLNADSRRWRYPVPNPKPWR